MILHWTVAGEYLGGGETDPELPADCFASSAMHWCCPGCGEVWAQCVPAPYFNCEVYHYFLPEPCPSCGVTEGCLDLVGRPHLLALATKAVLVRELLLAAERPEDYAAASKKLKRNLKKETNNDHTYKLQTQA